MIKFETVVVSWGWSTRPRTMVEIIQIQFLTSLTFSSLGTCLIMNEVSVFPPRPPKETVDCYDLIAR